MLAPDLNVFLDQYKEYAGYFAKHIFSEELWHEQTGCEVDEYFNYVSCCESKLFEFSTWYEHSTGHPFPEDSAWEFYKDFKPSLMNFHA